MDNDPFSPYEHLATRLLPHSQACTGDGSHDFSHLMRVWKNVSLILAAEGGDGELLAAATLLHDCAPVEKNSPMRSQASRRAAEKATEILIGIGWSKARSEAAAHAIEAHSFAAQVEPQTLEARILRDADRLDAIGAVGVARCFYVAGRMGSALYDPGDPLAENRKLNDSRYALDHFPVKLLRLEDEFQTATGCRLARQRIDRIKSFYEAFVEEIGVDGAESGLRLNEAVA